LIVSTFITEHDDHNDNDDNKLYWVCLETRFTVRYIHCDSKNRSAVL